MLPDILSVALRALSFVAMFQAAGVAIFIAIFGRDLASSVRIVRRIGYISALMAVIFVAGHYFLEAARMAGDLTGALDMSMQQLVIHSSLSVAGGLKIAGLFLIAVGLTHENKFGNFLSLIGALGVVVAFMFVGHTPIHPKRAWLELLLLVHLWVVAFWFGALAPLYVITLKETALVASALVERFTRIATWAVPAIFIAGGFMTWILLPKWSALLEPYGELLLTKVTLFGLLMGLATLNKWHFGPAMRSDARAVVSLQRAVAIEYLLIVGVLTATAVMTTFFSPEQEAAM